MERSATSIGVAKGGPGGPRTPQLKLGKNFTHVFIRHRKQICEKMVQISPKNFPGPPQLKPGPPQLKFLATPMATSNNKAQCII